MPRLGYKDFVQEPILRYSGRSQEKFPDLMIEAVVEIDGLPMHLPVFTNYKSFSR